MRLFSRQIAFWGFLTFALCLAPLFLLQVRYGAGFPIHPFSDNIIYSFSDDMILTWNVFQGLIQGDVHPFREIVLPRMAAPFSPLVFSEGFPLTEQLQLAVLKGLSYLIRDPIQLGDSYYILGYLLAAIAFFGSAVYLKIRPPIAFGLSIAFAYFPFHWIRYGHIFLSQYWVLAPAAAVLFRSTQRKFEGVRSKILLWLFAFFVTLWHSYYGFFFCGVFGLILAARGWSVSVETGKRDFLKPAIFLVGIVGSAAVLAIGLSTAHYVIARKNSIDPPMEFRRSPGEASMFKLRPPAVLLPVDNHRFPPFAHLRTLYMERIRHREGVNESLGSLAFLGIAFGIFALVRFLRNKRPEDEFSDLGLCQLLVFVFAGPWGIATIISLWITPVFRCPNRISPMLGAFALFTVGIWISKRLDRGIRFEKKISIAAGLFLALFAVWDQVPAVEYNPKTINEIASVRDFVSKIDEELGTGDVLQLPIVGFPEMPSIHGMHDYAHSIGPLFSREVRYSYGAWKGTSKFGQIQEAGKNPLNVDQIRAFGYSGIWIDRWGYSDLANPLIEALKKKLNQNPIWSSDGRRVFFNLKTAH